MFTPLIARTVRAAVLQERELDYIAAARLRGEGPLYIMFVEILPNVFSPIVVEFTVRLAYAIFTVLTLTFLGFGVQPPSPDWGLDISTNYGVVTAGYWWEVLFDALAIASLVVAVTLVSESIEGGAGAMSTAPNRAQPGAAPAQVDALAVEHLDITYRVRGRPPASCATSRSGSRAASRTGWWASRAAGSRRSRWPSSATCRATARSAAARSRSTAAMCSAMRGGELRKLRADTVSMVYQEPGKSLNPTIRVGRQVAEVFELAGLGKAESLDRSARCSRRCGSPTRPG